MATKFSPTWILGTLAVFLLGIALVACGTSQAAENTPAPAPLAQQDPAPAAATSPQTVQLTPAERQTLHKQLSGAVTSAPGSYRSTPQAVEKMYEVKSGLRTRFNNAAYTVIKAEVVGPITQEANGLNKALVRVKVEALTAPNTTQTAHKDLTLYFTLDTSNGLKQVVDVRN